jgi:hypothetical protein
MKQKAAPPKRGKILKVRLGYNANSSALATQVALLLLGASAVVTVLNVVGAALFSRKHARLAAGPHKQRDEANRRA